MLEEISILISVVALVFSATSLYLYYKQFKKTIGAAIKHELVNLPPYKSDEEETIIRIRNMGNAVANIEGSFLSFSWYDDLLVGLDWGFGEYEEITLTPNEEKVFYRRLPQPPDKEGKYIVKIETEYDGLTKDDEFPIRVRPRVNS